MACNGCNYTGNCGDYLKASYIPCSDANVSAAYSHMPSQSYVSNVGYDVNSMLANYPAVANTNYNVPNKYFVPSKDVEKVQKSSSGITVLPSQQAIIVPEEKTEVQKVHDPDIELLMPEQNLPSNVRLREIEIEETLILKRRFRKREILVDKE